MVGGGHMIIGEIRRRQAKGIKNIEAAVEEADLMRQLAGCCYANYTGNYHSLEFCPYGSVKACVTDLSLGGVNWPPILHA
jgi:hypothetical protein